MYKVVLSNKAEKELEKLQDDYFKKVDEVIFNLAHQPRPVGSLKLTEKEGYRIRVGNYRILYTINELQKEVIVYKIAHRKDAYRGLFII